jgi:hypothetical protein
LSGCWCEEKSMNDGFWCCFWIFSGDPYAVVLEVSTFDTRNRLEKWKSTEGASVFHRGKVLQSLVLQSCPLGISPAAGRLESVGFGMVQLMAWEILDRCASEWFFMFPNSWDDDPIWLSFSGGLKPPIRWILWISIQLGMSSSQLTIVIFFRGIETTNQTWMTNPCVSVSLWRHGSFFFSGQSRVKTLLDSPF